MGSCISSHNKASKGMSKVQVSFDTTNTNKTVDDHRKVTIYPSLLMNEGLIAVKPQLPPSQSAATFSDYGSKEETFFDSQAWLDSDCDDEFMSVNGEFTPSRGSTPVHHSSTLGTQRVNVVAASIDNIEPVGSTFQPSPTPTEKRKRLLDLFKESLRGKSDSTLEFGETTNKDSDMGLNKNSLKPKSGCFSSLISARTTGRQKKKTLTPSPNLARSPITG
ncbi:hypothetical protein CTI12_AA559740 [Artemisia annua]|uniref:Uncharacterized protein n=1 Tax=Artemisia annua TaxID=35608 RepID=A0A2U1KVL7_ARTAN|nr:hypothetical protein CTI12_AA559740 [Artemisia annua]